MVGVRKRGEEIRQFILDNVAKRPFLDISKTVGEAFDISRQAVNRHIRQLVDQNIIEVSGSSRKPRYSLKPLFLWKHTYPLDGKLEEDRVWRTDDALFTRHPALQGKLRLAQLSPQTFAHNPNRAQRPRRSPIR